MIVQATHRFPIPDEGDWDDRLEYMRERVRDQFGRELMRVLSERGGIVGPIHEEETKQKDWLWNTGMIEVTFEVYAKMTEMPEPERYRMMGGPADGQVQLTGGAPTWVIPFLPPLNAADPFDIHKDAAPRYAEYEREGDTQVYTFRRIR